MKRRGFSPSTRTFQTMFAGLSRIEHWYNHSKQLVNAHAVFDYFQRHLEAVKKHDPHSPELTITPIASYIKILGDAGEYQRIFDVYYAMDQQGSLAPNQFIFAAIFRCLSERRAPSGGDGRTNIHAQNASDAKLLWRQMLKTSERSPGFPIDSHIIAAAIVALSRGHAADQNFALEIVHDYLGLTKPKEATFSGKIPLTVHTLSAALSLCNEMREHRLCIHFLNLVRNRPGMFGGIAVIDRGNVEEVLKAYAAVATPGSQEEPYQALRTLEWMLKQEITGPNGPQIRPAATTYNLVLAACWRGVDWTSATRTFELMTGYTTGHFEDGQDNLGNPVLRKRAKKRNLVPDAETMSYMVRIALASRNPAYMRQSLRMVNYLSDHLFGLASGSDLRKKESKKTAKHATFYHVKLAAAVSEAIDCVLPRDRAGEGGESASWIKLKGLAGEILRRASPTRETGMA